MVRKWGLHSSVVMAVVGIVSESPLHWRVVEKSKLRTPRIVQCYDTTHFVFHGHERGTSCLRPGHVHLKGSPGTMINNPRQESIRNLCTGAGNLFSRLNAQGCQQATLLCLLGVVIPDLTSLIHWLRPCRR